MTDTTLSAKLEVKLTIVFSTVADYQDFLALLERAKQDEVFPTTATTATKVLEAITGAKP